MDLEKYNIKKALLLSYIFNIEGGIYYE